MASGVTVSDDCVSAFQEIKLGHKWQYVIFRLSEDLKKIHVAEKAGLDKTYDDFVEQLRDAEKQGQCRYGVFDVKYIHNDMQRAKLAFFLCHNMFDDSLLPLYGYVSPFRIQKDKRTNNGEEELQYELSPDTAPIKQKMVYSSSLKALKQKLVGIHVEIQCNDESDLEFSHVLEKCTERYN